MTIYSKMPGQEDKTITINDEDYFDFTTLDSEEIPTVGISDTATTSPDSITLGYTANQSVQLEIECKKIVSPIHAIDCGKKYGIVEITKAGRPTKTEPAGLGSVTVTGLNANSDYVFSGRAINKNGIEVPLAFTRAYKTAPWPTTADFREAVDYEIHPDKVVVRWRWTSKPTSSSVRLLIGKMDSGTATESTASRIVTFNEITNDVPNRTSTASIKISTITEAIESTAAKSAPTISVTINDGNKSVNREFTFSLIVPKSNTSSISTETTEAVSNFAKLFENANGNGKIKLRDLVKIGLPIVLTFL